MMMMSWRRLACIPPRYRSNWTTACRIVGSNFYSTTTPTLLSTTTTTTKHKQKLLTVSILGPPNAGKSTLFNRLLDKESNKAYRLGTDKKKHNQKQHKNRYRGGMAIVNATPGTTRDRRECIGRIGGTYFRLMDTAGVDGERLDHLFRPRGGDSDNDHHDHHKNVEKDASLIIQAMMKQTAQAAIQADLILLMFDGRVGVTNDLLEITRWLRRLNAKEVAVLANKLEGDAWDYDGSPILDYLDEATRVGFGQAIPISAIHGEGMSDIAVIIEETCQKVFGEDTASHSETKNDGDDEGALNEKPLQLAILGRQNVGKSTLVNALLQDDRVLVGSTPGLTRDAIAVEWSWEDRPVQLVDTAGIRKRSKRDHSTEIEDLAVQDAMRAMKLADVAVLVIDAGARTLQRQELAIADEVLREGRALVVVANKMDLIVDETNINDENYYSKAEFIQAVREQLETRFPELRKTPIVAMSSLTGEAVQDLMPVVFQARDRWARKIPTSQLNRWIKEVLQRHAPPMVGGVPLRIKYITQTKGRPPTFLLFCNTDSIPQSYLSYLTRNFQDTFEMYGMEVRLAAKLSAATNPYGNTNKRAGSGLGGREARKERTIHKLKSTGAVTPQRRRRRRDNWK